MGGMLVVQAQQQGNLDEEDVADLKQRVTESLEDLGEFEDVNAMYQEEQGVESFGYFVAEDRTSLVDDPEDAQYLGIILIDPESGETVSEKFISNPALKMQKGRSGLAFSILSKNGVDEVWMISDPTKVQTSRLNEMDLDYRTVDLGSVDELLQQAGELV